MRIRGGKIWLLGVSLLLCVAAPVNAEGFAKLAGSSELGQAATAITYSADEALVAMGFPDGKVQLHDRASGKPIASFTSPENPVRSLVADVRQRRLVVAGEKRMELWNLENLESGEISESQKLWSLDARAEQVQISPDGSTLRWLEGGKVKESPLESLSPKERTDLPEASGFTVSPDGSTLAVAQPKEGKILLQENGQDNPDLDYHLFPVKDLKFLENDQLLSVDQAGNLIWGNTKTRLKERQVQIPRSEDAQELQIKPLSGGSLVMAVQQFEDQTEAVVLDTNGRELQRMDVSGPEAVAISPTGAHIAVADKKGNARFMEAPPAETPEQYAQRLQASGATETARRYLNQLGPAETSKAPGPSEVALLEDGLKVALQTSQWLEADRVSRELLRLNPQNAAARAAQVQLQGRQDLLQLERAKKLMDAGEFERAVGVLIRVPVESELYQQARDLIREAEAKSQIQQNLKNARDSIRVGNWDQARFQIKKVLDQDPNNPEALALLKEIEAGEQADLVKFWGIPAVVLVSFAGLGLYLVRRRPRWLQKVVVDEGQAPEGQRPFRVRQEPPEAKSSGPSLDEQRYREALTKTTELLRLALRKDAHREHAVRLMDFQAEIKVIAQKGEAPDADFRRLTTQLLVLQQTLRGMKFRGKARGKETGTRPKSEEQSQQKQSSEQASGPEPAAPSGNYYELLGVSPSAPLEEIKKAYHQKLKEYHPDRHQSSEFSWVREQAEAMTLKLRQAYDVLSDPAARQKYDRTL